MTLDQPTGYSYLHPVSRIASFVVKGPGTVRVRATQALQVTLTIAETFETFFGDREATDAQASGVSRRR